MRDLLETLTTHPVWSALGLTLIGLVLLLVLTGVSSALLRRSYGSPAPEILGRAVLAAGLVLVIWRLGGLKESGVARYGPWPVWLLALAMILYVGRVSLLTLYAQSGSNLAALLRLPGAGGALGVGAVVGLVEELLFRGLVMWLLLRAWGASRLGIIGAVTLSAALFAVVHATQIWTARLPRAAAGYLVLQTLFVALWWGGLVAFGGSVWPAVLAHGAINALMALQSLAGPMPVPAAQGYRQLMLYSLLPGVAAILLILRAPVGPRQLQ